MSVKPPNKAGATLSAWPCPQANASPSMAKGNNCSLVSGWPKSSFTANNPATALAALEPKPLPMGIFFFSLIFIPTSGRFIFCNKLITLALTVFFVGFKGNLPSSPSIEMMLTPGLSVISIISSSPGSFTAKPNTSNPQTTLATVAGAKTFIDSILASS